MTTSFQTIALVARRQSPRIIEPLTRLVALLKGYGITVLLDSATAEEYPLNDIIIVDRTTLGQLADLLIVLGGDGTMLSVARLVAPYQKPLLGINQGRLGFMTDIAASEIETVLPKMLAGNFVREERILLEATVWSQARLMCQSIVLNDVVFNRGALGTMIEFEIFIDEQFVYSQRSDGLIVATPTGSTAYSLASGGPILHPTLPAITLVPICPQSMSNRPIAVKDSAQVMFILTGGQGVKIHFDGQLHVDIEEKDRVCIQRYPHRLILLHPPAYNYYAMLRQKLHWGERLF